MSEDDTRKACDPMKTYVRKKKLVPLSFNKDYLVSEDGQIYSLRSQRWLSSKGISGGRKDGTGYPTVNIGGKVYYVRHLVAEAFLPPPASPDLELHNRNWDRNDSRVENLEWVTSSDRAQRLHDAGLVKYAKGVCQYDIEGNLVGTFPTVLEASRKTGIPLMSIQACLRNDTFHAGWYAWATDKYPDVEHPWPVIIVANEKAQTVQYFENAAVAAKYLGYSRERIRQFIELKRENINGDRFSRGFLLKTKQDFLRSLTYF